MSDDEVEGFEISDWDLENEFNPNRARRRMTKEQQMIGVFADDSEEESAPQSSFKRFDKKGPKNYSGPVRFISAGIQQSGKKDEKNKKKDETDEEDDDDTSRPKRGDTDYVPNSSSDSEDERPTLGRQKKSFSLNSDADIAGLRKKRPQKNSSIMKTGMGEWETFTKGIGSQILLGMGYEPGKGLGKNQQGITAPVEVHLRKGRGAIGAYGPEKKSKIQEKKLDDDIEEEKEFKAKLSQWRKTGDATTSNTKKKIKYQYRSVDQVIEDGKLRPNIKTSAGSELSRVKVIDMTGPEQRVLSGYHAIAGQKRPDESITETDRRSTTNFSLPELQHNLNLIVDMCEQNIIQNDRKKRYLSDRVVSLEAEQKNTNKIVDHHEKLINTLESVLEIVDKLMNKNDEMSLKEMADAFRKLQDKYYEEYKMNELGELASSLVGGKIKDLLGAWNPLVDPKSPIGMVKEWKDILDTGNHVQSRNGVNPYDQLIWNAWMPSIRKAVQQWECREPDGIIDLIETWMPLLPSWIIVDNILELLILPKLTSAVEEWNPLTDTVPIHTWIHPWLPHLGNHMDTVIYPIIRGKLGSALKVWYPSDRSARLMLQPWAQVFSRGDMDAFLVTNIVPKLEIALSEFVINPHQQHMEPWRVVYEWSTLLPNHTMVGLLDKYFFPKWLQTLAIWLNQSPNFDQITNWYTGWKKELNDQLLAEPIIKDWFKKALDLMNRVVEHQGHQPGAMEKVSYLRSLERTQPTMTQIPAMAQPHIDRLAEAMRTTSQMPTDFKDLVQKKCEERGILFIPLINRYKETKRGSKQLYKIGSGNLQAYVDRDVLFVSRNGNNFTSTGLNDLLDEAEL